jgi:hypothetical protein
VKRFIFSVFISLFLFFLFGSPLYAIDITVIGGLEDIIVEPEHLFRGKSGGLASSYESKEDATMMNITGTAGSDDAWEVRVRMKASSWPKEMTLQLRRTGDGDGGGALEGGSSYLSIGESDTFFFSGSGDRTAIPVRYKISGISLSVPAGRYSAVITYTIVDL